LIRSIDELHLELPFYGSRHRKAMLASMKDRMFDMKISSEIEEHGRMRVLGVPVSLVNMETAAQTILRWAKSGPAKTIFVRDIPSLMLTLKDTVLLAFHEQANLVVPDGTPLTWVGRLRGYGSKIGRTPGVELMEKICRESLHEDLGHYFFGGKSGVVDKMKEILTARYPGLRIVGIYSPPMMDIDARRPLNEDEWREIEAIRQARPDFIWVGMSSPKQEFWMMKASPQLDHGVFLGVGAAFDFLSGAVPRAPSFMRDNGLEWLYRLFKEPRRLWRRYLILAPHFVVKTAAEQLVSIWKN
jgi:N-acetylglucosaminyldiphosphoundecaprenol N-acetyl-beta-D-mannosaminyltransferase